jgi:hypothetical protein
MPSNSALKQLFDEDQNERRTRKFSKPEEEKRRRTNAEFIISDIISPTKEDYYYIAVLFNHGNCIDDYKKAHQYAQESVNLGLFQPTDLNSPDNGWLAAVTFDRLQIEQVCHKNMGGFCYT